MRRRALVHSDDNYWRAENPGPGDGPFTVRITDIFGQHVTVAGVALAPDQVQRTGARLYGPGSGGTATAAPAPAEPTTTAPPPATTVPATIAPPITAPPATGAPTTVAAPAGAGERRAALAAGRGGGSGGGLGAGTGTVVVLTTLALLAGAMAPPRAVRARPGEADLDPVTPGHVGGRRTVLRPPPDRLPTAPSPR